MRQGAIEAEAPRKAKHEGTKRPHPALSHNLLGQRLGRKGRGTRERILAAAERVLADPAQMPLSLSAVAREASLGMTSLYLYFGDLTELVVAVLEPVMQSAEDAYLAQMRPRWDEEALAEQCLAFVGAFHAFWERHSAILHLRNTYGLGDPRVVRHRVDSARPLIDLLTLQMDGDPARTGIRQSLATVLVTGMERVVTVATDAELANVFENGPNVPNLLRGQARLLELGIRDGRGSAQL